MRCIRLALLAGLSLLLAACAATGPRFSEVQSSLPALSPGNGRIVFYRPQSMMGAALSPQVRVDGQPVGALKVGSFLLADVPAGKHVASASTEAESSVDLSVAAGDSAYVRMAIVMGLVAGRPELTWQPALEAQKELGSLAYGGGKPIAIARGSAPALPAGAATPAAATPHAAAPAAALPAATRGTEYEYVLRDRLTRGSRKVVYRLDRMDGDRFIFNQGSRVEKAGGVIVSNTAPLGGDYDIAQPPGGWVSGNPQPGATWAANYRTDIVGNVVAMRLNARVLGETTLRVKDRDLRVQQVQFTGYTERNYSLATNPPGRYTATAWYSPELGRVVRFEAKTRGGVGGGAFYVDEQLELVDIRQD